MTERDGHSYQPMGLPDAAGRPHLGNIMISQKKLKRPLRDFELAFFMWILEVKFGFE